MLFEIINNAIENLLIGFFVIKYINLDKQKNKFIFNTVVINTILSTILTYKNIIGLTQTLLIQCVICFFLYRYNDQFSFQNIIVSFFCNILLYIAVYFSIIFLSYIYNMIPFQIYTTYQIYIYQIILSKIIFLLMIILSLIKKPLLFTKIEYEKINYLVAFELLINIIMGQYFLTIILNKNFNFLSCILFFLFILLFFLFCYIFNSTIKMNQEIYESKLKIEQEHYKHENLKNLNTIKMQIDNTEHRINYILQSIEFDLKDKQYDNALNKIKISKELINKISPIVCTNNELFDFILNLEIKYFMQNNKQIKICIFISQNRVYDRIEIINNIIDILKILYSDINQLELFIIESESNYLQVRFIISNSNSIKKNIIYTANQNIQILENEKLIIIEYEENLNEYM